MDKVELRQSEKTVFILHRDVLVAPDVHQGRSVIIGVGSRVQARGCFIPYIGLAAACLRNASSTDADDSSPSTRYVIWVASRRTRRRPRIWPSCRNACSSQPPISAAVSFRGT